MKILLSGSHGLIGSNLKSYLETKGHQVERLGRNLSDAIDLSNIDSVIHLAGENIAEGRWTDKKKKAIKQSRIEGTLNISRQIASSDTPPTVFISASAIGFYGDRGGELVNEDSSSGTGFLPDVCSQWENQTQVATDSGIRTVHLRTGIVLSNQGGALKKMLPPFKAGGGGIMGNGKQFMSWISMDDMIGGIEFILDNPSIKGPVNMVAPNALSNHDFTKVLGHILKRPTILPLPAFAARLLFGEMADALLLSSTRVSPDVLLNTGYQFKHPDLESALRAALNEKK